MISLVIGVVELGVSLSNFENFRFKLSRLPLSFIT